MVKVHSTLLDGIIKIDISPEAKHRIWEQHAHSQGEANVRVD